MYVHTMRKPETAPPQPRQSKNTTYRELVILTLPPSWPVQGCLIPIPVEESLASARNQFNQATSISGVKTATTNTALGQAMGSPSEGNVRDSASC